MNIPSRSFTISILVLLGVGPFVPLQVSAVRGAPHGSRTVATASSELVCPSHSNPHHIKLWIHVTRWCALPAVRGQAQFKIQMRIHNRDDQHRLDISHSRMRLIVHVFHADRWTPARVGEPTIERPIRTTYGREHVWAVPPNAEDAFDPLPHQPGVGTFATHWGGSVLGPGKTFNPHFHFGDLVFYVPTPRDGSGALDNVVGIAYVKGHEIIALCHPWDWGPKVPAESF